MLKSIKAVSLELFSGQTKDLLFKALMLAQADFKHTFVGYEHVVIAMLDIPGTNAYKVLEWLEVDQDLLREIASDTVKTQTHISSGFSLEIDGFTLPMSGGLSTVLNTARDYMKAQDAKKIGTDHLLVALTELTETAIMFKAVEIEPQKVRDALGLSKETDVEEETGDELVTDFVALVDDSVEKSIVSRQAMTNEILNLLLHASHSGVVLHGERGTGRWQQILGLAKDIKSLANRPFGLVGFQPDVHLSNPLLEVQQAIEYAMKQNAVLVLPHFERYWSTHNPHNQSIRAVLRRAMSRGQIRVVFVTEQTALKAIKEDLFFGQLPLMLNEEASTEETEAVLSAQLDTWLEHYGVRVDFGDLVSIVSLSKYLPGHLPGKAIELAQAGCAETLRIQLQTDVSTGSVRSDVYATVVERRTGIPVSTLVGQDRKKLANMESIMHTRYINQYTAVTALSNAIRHARSPFHDPKRPNGTFLFLGPSGVGKTELARVLAWFLFDSEDALIEYNMTEFTERHAVSGLLGSPSGYQGHGEDTLFHKVARKPYSVVLFDEIEKAHEDVWKAVLEIMEDGYVTLRSGEQIDFRNTVILMTSNVGSKHVTGQDPALEEKLVIEASQNHFPPEFLNRFDGIEVFRTFKQDELLAIAELMMLGTHSKAKVADLNLTVPTAELQKLVLARFTECQRYGARPLRRAIKGLEELLASGYIDGSFVAGADVLVTFSDSENQLIAVLNE